MSNSQIEQMDIMIMACTFCDKYDEWKNDENIMKILNTETNSFCKSLKYNYQLTDNKIIQSITLAHYMTLLSICNENYTLLPNDVNNDYLLYK